MERQAVSSSNLASVGYDPNSETLEVEFVSQGRCTNTIMCPSSSTTA